MIHPSLLHIMITTRGFTKIFILLALLAISAAIATTYFGVTPSGVWDALRTTSQSFVDDTRTVAVDKAMEEGRQVVGEKLKTTGEKMLGTDAPAGQFVPYDAALIGTQPYTVIFFTGAQCTACASARMSFDSNRNAIPSDVIILEASYDHEALRQRYAVHEPATFILLDRAGLEIKRWANTRTLDALRAEIPR